MKICYISKIKTLINNQGKINNIKQHYFNLSDLEKIFFFFFLGGKKCIIVEQGIVKSNLQ